MELIVADICLSNSLHVFYTQDLTFCGIPISLESEILQIENASNESIIFIAISAIVAIEVAEITFNTEGLTDEFA